MGSPPPARTLRKTASPQVLCAFHQQGAELRGALAQGVGRRASGCAGLPAGASPNLRPPGVGQILEQWRPDRPGHHGFPRSLARAAMSAKFAHGGTVRSTPTLFQAHRHARRTGARVAAGWRGAQAQRRNQQLSMPTLSSASWCNKGRVGAVLQQATHQASRSRWRSPARDA